MDPLARITASVAAETSLDDSVIALLSQLSAALKAAATNPAAINALADALDAKQAEVSAALIAATPITPAAAAKSA
jgi:hypothetical protein